MDQRNNRRQAHRRGPATRRSSVQNVNAERAKAPMPAVFKAALAVAMVGVMGAAAFAMRGTITNAALFVAGNVKEDNVELKREAADTDLVAERISADTAAGTSASRPGAPLAGIALLMGDADSVLATGEETTAEVSTADTADAVASVNEEVDSIAAEAVSEAVSDETEAAAEAAEETVEAVETEPEGETYEETEAPTTAAPTTEAETEPPVQWWDTYEYMFAETILTVREGPGTWYDAVDYLAMADDVYVLAQSDDGWSKVSYGDITGYVASAYLTYEQPELPTEPEPETTAYVAPEPVYEEPTTTAAPVVYSWDGGILTPSKGVNAGPSGTETYYNWDMTIPVQVLRQRGYVGEVWVRSDGCKMFGDYIMCAAHYEIYPYGSLVESSLGTCIVCDTGNYPELYWLDIAVTW